MSHPLDAKLKALLYAFYDKLPKIGWMDAFVGDEKKRARQA